VYAVGATTTRRSATTIPTSNDAALVGSLRAAAITRKAAAARPAVVPGSLWLSIADFGAQPS
jgi:hypothetical protein